MSLECGYCNGDETHEKHVVCPACEESGFDGKGAVIVEGARMYQRQCWNCGTTFAVETDDPREVDDE